MSSRIEQLIMENEKLGNLLSLEILKEIDSTINKSEKRIKNFYPTIIKIVELQPHTELFANIQKIKILNISDFEISITNMIPLQNKPKQHFKEDFIQVLVTKKRYASPKKTKGKKANIRRNPSYR